MQIKTNLEPPILSNGRITGWGKMYLEFCGGDHTKVRHLNKAHREFATRLDLYESVVRISIRTNTGNAMPAHRN
jgi:hypothetical protein